jgi:hypothetical protein
MSSRCGPSKLRDSMRTLWTDEDRSWASRAAAEVVGADAEPKTFLARRAALVIEKVGARQPALPRAVHALRWRRWVGAAVVVFAFALGLFVDQVGQAQQINILAPPVLGLLLWNLGVYVAIAVGYVARYGDASEAGPLRSAITRFAAGFSRPRRGGAIREPIVNLSTIGRAIAPLFTPFARRASCIWLRLLSLPG